MVERSIAHALTCFASASPGIPRNVSVLTLLRIHVLVAPPKHGVPNNRSNITHLLISPASGKH